MDGVYIKRDSEDLMVNYKSMMVVGPIRFQSMAEQRSVWEEGSGNWIDFSQRFQKWQGPVIREEFACAAAQHHE